MLNSIITEKGAYLGLSLWVLCFWAGAFYRFPLHRTEQVFMSLCGGLGGVLVAGPLYRMGFWNPQPLWGWQSKGVVYFDPADFIFGFAFLGIVAISVQAIAGYQLLAEEKKSTGPLEKLAVLCAVPTAGILVALLGGNVMVVTIVGLLFGSMLMVAFRPDLVFVVLRGGVLSLLSYGILVGDFLLFLYLANVHVDALGRALSPYYVAYGPLKTAGTLALWAFVFGAFFASFYACMKNKYYDRA